MNKIKFRKYFVSNGKYKAKVWYCRGNRIDGRDCVTIYAKEFTNDLHKIIPFGYENESDSQTDYFEKGRVVIFAENPLFSQCVELAV